MTTTLAKGKDNQNTYPTETGSMWVCEFTMSTYTGKIFRAAIQLHSGNP